MKVEGIEPEKENPGGEERRGDCLINLTALTTCAGVCYAMLRWQGGGDVCGGQCPLKTAPASCAPLQETFLEMQKFAQHKLCFVKMFTLFIVLLLLVASSAWLSLLGALTLPPIRTACYTEKNEWQLMLVTYGDDA